MRWPPFLIWTFLLASAPAQEAPGTREFPLVDLVRAADGKIGVYAINLKTGQEIGHNAGMPYHLGSARSIPVAAAALAKLRAAGLPLSHPLPYPETSFRGFGIRDQSHVLLRPRRDERHGRPWPVNAIVEAAIRFEDLSALDLLIDYVTPEGVSHWLEKTAKIQGFGPITTVAAEEKLVFGFVNKRFQNTPPHTLARWYRNGETKAIVPAFFVSDPRSDGSFRSDLARARRKAAGLKENSVSPRAMASLLMRISRGTAGHPDDCKFLWRLLEGSRPLRFTYPLPLSWRSGGRDGAGPGFRLWVWDVTP